MAKLARAQVMVAQEMVDRGVAVRQVARQLGVTEGALRYRLRQPCSCSSLPSTGARGETSCCWSPSG